jgi:hypothetical protein
MHLTTRPPLAIHQSMSSKVPYQANNSISPVQGQQGGKEPFKAVLGQRVGIRQNRD